MDFKVVVFSDNVLKGFTNFDLQKLNEIFANCLVDMEKLDFLPIEKSSSFVCENNNIIFSENENIDNLIIEHYSQLGSEKEIIDEQIVVFKKRDYKTIFIPLESDMNLLTKILENSESKVCKFHIFGMDKNLIISNLEELKKEILDLKYKIITKNIISDVYVSYTGEDNLIDDKQVKIASLFKNNMFSENDLNLENIIFQLLKMKNLSLSICENVTNGEIISSLLKENIGFENVLKIAQIKFFDKFDNDFLHKQTTNLLQESGCDIAIVTNGKIEGNVFNFVFTIADKNEVHFYKCNFTGNLKNSIAMAKNTLLYHVVKKLRQNDFVF